MTSDQLAANPDWQAFLVKIRATPDDDLPRLVACDWLEEHGENELAAFIRSSIARKPHTPTHHYSMGYMFSPSIIPLIRRGFIEDFQDAWENNYRFVLMNDDACSALESHPLVCFARPQGRVN